MNDHFKASVVAFEVQKSFASKFFSNKTVFIGIGAVMALQIRPSDPVVVALGTSGCLQRAVYVCVLYVGKR